MTKRQDIALSVATQLKTLEDSLGQSALLTAQFAADLVVARRDANLGFNVGATALTKVATSLGAIAKACEDLADAHRDLAGVGRAMGVRTDMVLGGDKMLSEAAATAALREVA